MRLLSPVTSFAELSFNSLKNSGSWVIFVQLSYNKYSKKIAINYYKINSNTMAPELSLSNDPHLRYIYVLSCVIHRRVAINRTGTVDLASLSQDSPSTLDQCFGIIPRITRVWIVNMTSTRSSGAANRVTTAIYTTMHDPWQRAPDTAIHG